MKKKINKRKQETSTKVPSSVICIRSPALLGPLCRATSQAPHPRGARWRPLQGELHLGDFGRCCTIWLSCLDAISSDRFPQAQDGARVRRKAHCQHHTPPPRQPQQRSPGVWGRLPRTLYTLPVWEHPVITPCWFMVLVMLLAYEAGLLHGIDEVSRGLQHRVVGHEICGPTPCRCPDVDVELKAACPLQQDSGVRGHTSCHTSADLGIQSLVGSPDPELNISCQFQGQGSSWKGKRKV